MENSIHNFEAIFKSVNLASFGPEKDRFEIFGEALVESDLSLLLGLLGEEDSLDVGEDTTLGNGDSSQELVQLLVIPDGKLQVPGDDPGLLVVTGSIACQLKDLSGEVLHDGSEVHWGPSADTLGIVTLTE